jgi:hypothetical protein
MPVLKASNVSLPQIQSTWAASFKPIEKLSAQSPNRAEGDGGNNEKLQVIYRDWSMSADVRRVSQLRPESG